MKIIIIHGTDGSPAENWFPWLKLRLEAQGHEVIAPPLPTPKGQSKDTWLAALTNQEIIPDAQTILIGHSCGATFLLHLLQQYKVMQSIFVSPVMGELGLPAFDALNRSFYDHVFDWRKIKINAGHSVILHGDNDPYVPLRHAQELHTVLGGKLVIIPGGGHLNSESGFTSFPLLIDVLKIPTP